MITALNLQSPKPDYISQPFSLSAKDRCVNKMISVLAVSDSNTLLLLLLLLLLLHLWRQF